MQHMSTIAIKAFVYKLQLLLLRDIVLKLTQAAALISIRLMHRWLTMLLGLHFHFTSLNWHTTHPPPDIVLRA